jgi:hypothetical protein
LVCAWKYGTIRKEFDMPQFMLALYDDPTRFRKMSPEQMQKSVEKYMVWGKNAFIVQGKRLADDAGRVLRGGSGKPRVTDGPYSETKEILGGIYIIEAANYDEAVTRIQDHPHLEHGTIELRQLWGE